jgi:ADP-ribosylglycohydrolase
VLNGYIQCLMHPSTGKREKIFSTFILMNIDGYTGCLLGGAVGDALGAPAEFMSLTEILDCFGQDGIQDYVEFPDGKGRITDDTQMTLFTAEGLLKAGEKLKSKNAEEYLQVLYEAYLRWLHTQSGFIPQNLEKKPDLKGGLLEHPKLFRRRSPGTTCLSALQSGRMGTISKTLNDSKGCGGVMRVAPVGLIRDFDTKTAFRVAADIAAITHGHPSGYLSAGALAALLTFIRHGSSLDEAIRGSLEILAEWKGSKETLTALGKAVSRAGCTDLGKSVSRGPSFKDTERLGGGWTGEEALAISVYCSLRYPDDFEKAVVLAINHGGDSDSTGAITGNILGLLLGKKAIPGRWLENLELRELITTIALKLSNRV